MNFKSDTIIAAISTTLLLAVTNASSSIGHETEINLMNFMARSNALLQQDPARSLDCFNFYIPLINQIAKDYETNFKACQNESEAAHAKADEATYDQRKNLAGAAENSCNLLRQCSEGESVEGIFQCYIDGGAGSINIMYGINANASQELAALREQYYLIKAEEYKCTNETKRVYEQKSAAAYASLNSCILGTSEVPTNPPATAAPEQPSTEPQPEQSTTESPTNPPPTAEPEQPSTEPQPEQTTAEPSPAEPEATTQEAESTGEVSTSEPPTEQPNTVAPDNSENYD